MLLGYGSEVPKGQVDAELAAYAELLDSEGNLLNAKEFSEYEWTALTPEELAEIF